MGEKKTPPAKGPKDEVLVVGRPVEGPGVHVLRRRRDKVEAGLLTPAQDGKPVQGELLRLTRTERSPLLYEAETVFDGSADKSAEAGAGPAQVASSSYRKNWDRVFRRKRSAGDALPN